MEPAKDLTQRIEPIYDQPIEKKVESRYEKVVSQFAKEQNIPDDKGHFTLGECDFCGTIALTDLKKDLPRSFDLIKLGKDCPNCSEVHRRCPEVFMWTMNSMATMHSSLLKAIRENKKGG